MSLTFNDWILLVSYLSVAAWVTYAIHECTKAVLSVYDEHMNKW